MQTVGVPTEVKIAQTREQGNKNRKCTITRKQENAK